MQFRYQIIALFWLTVAVIAPVFPVTSAGLAEVVYAINAGGDAHVDSLGVRYDKDPLHGKVVYLPFKNIILKSILIQPRNFRTTKLFWGKLVYVFLKKI